MLKFLQAFVKKLLENPLSVEWTTQGFGMIRCYPFGSDEIRLNIWHSAFKVPAVSSIHDHPWNLESLVVAGVLTNQRFSKDDPNYGAPMQHVKLKPGRAVLLTDIDVVKLMTLHHERYLPGCMYWQRAEEIHETGYIDGTVTINRRTNRGPDVANVYWPEGPWVSAKPELATPSEIKLATAAALDLLKGG